VGVVRVISLTATVAGVELVRITSDRKSSSSLANWRAYVAATPAVDELDIAAL
jgi:hypothetical protein